MMAKAKLRYVTAEVRNAVIEECAMAVPTTWLDPLLGVIENSPCPEIEALLRGIRDRIRALKSD